MLSISLLVVEQVVATIEEAEAVVVAFEPEQLRFLSLLTQSQ